MQFYLISFISISFVSTDMELACYDIFCVVHINGFIHISVIPHWDQNVGCSHNYRAVVKILYHTGIEGKCFYTK